MSIILDYLLFYAAIVILFVSIFLSIKTRFVQIRLLPEMLRQFTRLLKGSKAAQEGAIQEGTIQEGTIQEGTIQAHKALFTAMSTTLGISTIVGPVVAIHLGGPGALVGFLVTMIFGPAANFAEVTLALAFRKKSSTGQIMGGPMQYLKDGVSPFLAHWYACACLLLMVAWSSAQANQLASVLSMPLLGQGQVDPLWTATFVAVGVLVILFGGIKRIGELSAKLVPTMFLCFVGGAGWIVLSHVSQLPGICELIVSSAFTPQAMGSGIVVGGIAQSLRWGVLKGIHSSEAGIGTQTIPHSMAENEHPAIQGMLSMAATYSAGFVSILSGLVVLIAGTWQDANLPLGISMVVEAFRQNYSFVGTIIVMVSTILFAFGTILGNSYNGGECFRFLTRGRLLHVYYLLTAVGIFVGATCDVSAIWTVTDFFLAPLAVPHIIAILYLVLKRPELFEHRSNILIY